jgi:Putative Actinobacterial Holin-X, holin superfamily III
MVRSETPEPVGADQSLGDLVALAAKDVSQLIRYEIDLAKTELRADMRRVGLAGGLTGAAAFVGCLVLVLLSFAYAYGLVALGIWVWAAFLIAAGTEVLLAAIALGIAYLKLRRLSGLRRTRQSVTEGIDMLRREGQPSQGIQVGRDGDRPEIGRDGRPADVATRPAR